MIRSTSFGSESCNRATTFLQESTNSASVMTVELRKKADMRWKTRALVLDGASSTKLRSRFEIGLKTASKRSREGVKDEACATNGESSNIGSLPGISMRQR